MIQQTDFSRVPLQGGYIAKECPVVIQNRMTVPGLEVQDPAPDVKMRMEAGIRFEADIVARLATAAGDSWLLVPQDLDRELAQTLTMQAMAAQVPVIHNGYLEPDHIGRRVGRPDLLVYHRDGYLPVDIKHRLTLEAGPGGAGVSDPLTPDPDSMEILDSWTRRANKDDALQLAHYRRMLEALGLQSGSSQAGIIGKEGRIVWYDLDEPMWTTPSTSDPNRKTKRRSTLEAYDFEFDWRLKIAAAAIAVREGSGSLLVEPMWCGDCQDCGFVLFCSETLDQGSGDASKIPGNNYAQWRLLRSHGVRERADVAQLHYPTAALAKRGVDVVFFLEGAAGFPAGTPLSQIRPQAKKQIAELEAAGLTTVGDLASLDPLTAKLGGFLANQILGARAAVGPHPVYRKPEAGFVEVRRADIEIDLDMENMNEGVYLWGALLTDRTGIGGFDVGYRAFATWDSLEDEGSERVPFQALLAWIGDQESMARSKGLSLAVFVWHEAAENTQLRRIARKSGEGVDAAVEVMLASDSWVDLKKVFDAGWITGGSSGLKTIAPLAGHSWRVDDPGGGVAMARYTEAITEDSAVARTWLLDYNRGDVEATLAIREWLSREGHLWPVVATD